MHRPADPSLRRGAHLSRSLTIAAAILCCGCSLPNPLLGGYPLDSAFDMNVTLFEREVFGLKVGHRYRLIKAHTFYWDFEGKEAQRLPAGTTVVIKSVYRWNSLTSGYEYHLVATVEGADSKPVKIKIQEADAPLFKEVPAAGQ